MAARSGSPTRTVAPQAARKSAHAPSAAPTTATWSWSWTPDRPLAGSVIETPAVAGLAAADRAEQIRRLKAVTVPGGHHVVMPSAMPGAKAPAVSSDALRSLYADWTVERAQPGGTGRRPRNVGFIATQPAESQTDTAEAVSN